VEEEASMAPGRVEVDRVGARAVVAEDKGVVDGGGRCIG